MRYEGDDEAKLLRFVAIRPIAPGEELTVNYSAEGGGPRIGRERLVREDGRDPPSRLVRTAGADPPLL
jgi:hypothetical protein